MVQNNFFEEGTILYFTPFLFSDGARPKPKYFLVLKRLSELLGSQFKDEVLLVSLPTSKDFVPSTIEKRHGCIDKPEINFNCYYFQEGKSVCVNSFAFSVGTYIYGYRLQQFSVETFRKQEAEGKTVIEEKGKLTDAEYEAVVKCLKNSSSVKRAYRRML